jgi:hypothetical protein
MGLHVREPWIEMSKVSKLLMYDRLFSLLHFLIALDPRITGVLTKPFFPLIATSEKLLFDSDSFRENLSYELSFKV